MVKFKLMVKFYHGIRWPAGTVSRTGTCTGARPRCASTRLSASSAAPARVRAHNPMRDQIHFMTRFCVVFRVEYLCYLSLGMCGVWGVGCFCLTLNFLEFSIWVGFAIFTELSYYLRPGIASTQHLLRRVCGSQPEQGRLGPTHFIAKSDSTYIFCSPKG